ncbi:MAG: hypothetical protein COU32_01520 [Candidatus Magasanikbacteria bacterium CG10_big_fil_rev_8_21_14_0_10_42_10]|uniref:Uncharacterized protein n=2 Tax=Candidatus Magasanikiibacteriota TaxID=1752731 RepID=A0A2H0TWH8_9BACT|nr:MAG: hypothetical protein COU32_01520 [Candidatus Magasanikbacteria bacterium CG10_big_fil_rev_8_21_14_0_10_42_10]PIZ94036.1 MAG: hypothetical protein COX82_01430 [Candidatus Magasanikbacteria bacterium CG_4_10_14_0_2_um_filter_41_10]
MGVFWYTAYTLYGACTNVVLVHVISTLPVMFIFQKKHRFSQSDKRGFTLLEIVVAIGIFAIFAVGIYSGIQFVFRLVYNSRLRIIETSLLNEQIEGIRNMSFYDIGIVNGSPSGLLEYSVTTTRNGIDFDITRTIRNIDDPFDGTIDGTPQDLSPADYKLVDVSVICTQCRQQHALLMSTYVAPKYLEGDPTHGALFIDVFDASGQPVQGAMVHIVSTVTTPTYDFYDTTDNDGRLAIVDLAAGLEAYDITVTKDGYTTDQTMQPSVENANPVKLPATVLAQSVTEISFSIDLVSDISVQTLNAYCVPIGSTSVSLIGTKKIGTNPDVFLTDLNITTNGSGQYEFDTLVWDTYQFGVSGYNIIGSIPNERVDLLPGASQPVQLILGTVSTHALRVDVVDSVTGQPIANATVTVTSTGYTDEKVTGVGTVGQTDWSGGSGQDTLADNTRFFSDDGNVDVLTSVGNMTLWKTGSDYASSGWLESSTFDLGLDATYQNIIWEPLAQPAETGSDAVQFQIATASSTSPTSWNFFGPDGTAGTYYTAADTVISDVHTGDRYMRYTVFMTTASTTYTPTLSNVSFTYTNSCTPPGQVYFGSLSSGDYSISVSATGYDPTTVNVTVNGYTKESIILQQS